VGRLGEEMLSRGIPDVVSSILAPPLFLVRLDKELGAIFAKEREFSVQCGGAVHEPVHHDKIDHAIGKRLHASSDDKNQNSEIRRSNSPFIIQHLALNIIPLFKVDID